MTESEGLAARTRKTDRRLVTVSEAADYVGVHEKTVRRWISKGTVRGYHVGPRLVRVDLDEVNAMLVSPILAGGDR